MPDGTVSLGPEAPDLGADAMLAAISPHLMRASYADRARAATAAYAKASEAIALAARAKAQRDTAELRARTDQALAQAHDVELANADLRQTQVALRKAHQQAEERAQYWRAQFTIEADRVVKLELADRRQPWWAWWAR